ncbi:CaiB/BaiF CoA transferase family protein [Streptomyces sp. NPDC088746]|uniref:CaiB/BaiF CoA transferase family protein n=1 Tax=Streptomyces sp. NPDC088746 TaxID=3365885 RepID=UPI0037F10281
MSKAVLGHHSADARRGPSGPLEGLTVVDLSTTLPGAFATQFLADAGADVIGVEPPGGSPLRAHPGWPAIGRGRRSAVLDLRDEGGRTAVRGLAASADVLVTTFRPGTAERLGLDAGTLAELNPRLVSASITGFGATGPWRDIKGYEGVVMAKLGMFNVKKAITGREGPAFLSAPFASWGAGQTALHGTLTALLERESTGRGQHVEADLVRGATTIDTWAWFTELVGIRWPGAYDIVEAFTDDGEVLSPLIYPLLAAPTKDGRWLQFAQTEPRLFKAMIEELGLSWMWTDPKWKGMPALESQERRTELWEIMLRKVGERTFDEWAHVFETNANVSAEPYRAGREALNHPQLVHEGRVAEVTDPEHGTVRQPSTLIHTADGPLTRLRPAPRLDEDGERIRASAGENDRAVPPTASQAPSGKLPLEGLTVLEFGLMFAGPFGSTLLTDLGARVIKVESLEGDTIRRVMAFPEAGGVKVMQGKESICLDLRTEEGRKIVHELAARCDVVLQTFRAGAAERAGVDEATLKKINPDLVYLSAPGYGTDGPYGHRPAYAPSIGAATGLALTDAPHAAEATGSLSEIKSGAIRLNAATAKPSLQADGISALGVASAMLLGLLARARERPLTGMTTTMLATTSLALIDRTVDYEGRPAGPLVDEDGCGFSALYRMYRASDGWIFLAAPAPGEWGPLAGVLAGEAGLAEDERFATPESRTAHDEELTGVLAGIFAGGPAAGWEERLTAVDVGCAVVRETAPEILLQTERELVDEYTRTTVSPVFDEHLRLAPAVRFSRSATRANGACLAGDHTDKVLREIGYDDTAVSALRERGIVG